MCVPNDTTAQTSVCVLSRHPGPAFKLCEQASAPWVASVVCRVESDKPASVIDRGLDLFSSIESALKACTPRNLRIQSVTLNHYCQTPHLPPFMNADNSTPRSLLVIGAIHVDDIAHTSQALVARASNPVSWSRHVGGVGANAARAASRTLAGSVPVTFRAAVGDDAVARQLQAALLDSGLDTQLVHIPHAQTGRYTAILDHDGELYLGLADVSLAEELAVSQLALATASESCKAILMDANLSCSCLQGIATQAASQAIKLAAMSVSPVKTLKLKALASDIDLLFCNRREAMALCTAPHSSHSMDLSTPLSSLADQLQAQGFRQFVLTDGQAPLICQETSGRTVIPVPEVTTTHTVNGAGDALAGASFATWATGSSLADSLTSHGLPAAARVIQGMDTAPNLANTTQH